ncbi:MAG: cysteine desulfurase [Eubacterium sp.]|nr:cysteine desulfurase [Eubacterium sp.]
MICYLDNAATTRALPEVAELVSKVMTEDYGNPSSLHSIGFSAEKCVREAATRIAKTLKTEEKNIVFTSGGTESNNTALIGTALANIRNGKHIITTVFEHPSVSEPLIYLEKQGFEITFLPVGHDGRISEDELKSALRDDTIIVSIMMVNNEIGVVQDIEKLARTVKYHNRGIIFHSDVVQAYGKLPLRPKKWGIDLMSVSGHKFHGPKGTGFLYMADGLKTHPYIHGGGQQKNRRSGTENVPGISGLGLAAEIADREMKDSYERVSELSDFFITELRKTDGIVVHGRPGVFSDDGTCMETGRNKTDIPECCGYYSPYIISAGVEGVKSEVLLHALEGKGIFVSSGSACSSNHPGISGTLTAIGVDKTYLDSTIRFSLSRYTTREELDYTLTVLNDLLPTLRKFTKR